MNRGRFIWDKEKNAFVPYEKKQNIQAHSVITDEMAPLAHPANGKYYTSKKKFRDETRARDLVEIGNEKLPDPEKREFVDRGNRRQALIDALNIAKENADRRKRGRGPVDRTWRDRD